MEDPLSGHLFAFLNKRRNRIKVLYWDKDGFCILYKRLEKGTFLDSLSPEDGEVTIEPELFYMLFKGLDIHQIKRRKRLTLSKI